MVAGLVTAVQIRSRAGVLLLLAILVLGPALLIRAHPVVSEGFAHDAVVSQMAASKGILANAWDRDGTLWDRRAHPPLLSYIIVGNNALFGSAPFASRLFSILAGALACLVVSCAIYEILRGSSPWSLGCAVLGGWLLCLVPAHLYVSRTANWDAVYGLLAVCSLLCSGLYWVGRSRRTLTLALVFATLAFLTCEVAVSLVPGFLLLLYRDVRQHGLGAAVRAWLGPLGVAAATFILLWPAGVLKLDLFRALRFRLQDSLLTQRNDTWLAFYRELFHQTPGFTLAAAAGLLGWCALIVTRGRRQAGRSVTRPLGMLVPFAVYVGVAFLFSIKQRLVYVHHIVDMIPPLSILAGSMAGLLMGRSRATRLLVVVVCLGVLSLSLAAGLRSDPDIVGPQEHPGLLGTRELLQGSPRGARLLLLRAPTEILSPWSAMRGQGTTPVDG